MVDDFRRVNREKYREWFDRGRHGRNFEDEYQKHNQWFIEEFIAICESIGFKTVKIEQRGDYWLTYIGKK